MKLKLLGAALLAAAMAAPAYADIAQATSGNGEFFLTVWDTNGTADGADDRSYTLDLGINLNSFASAAVVPVVNSAVVTEGYSQSWAADALLTSFLSTANLANVSWNVMAGDGVGAHRMAMTVSDGFSGDSNRTTAQLREWDGQMDSYLIAVNAMMTGDQTNTATYNESIVATNADGAAFGGDSGVSFGSTLGSKLDFTNAGGIGGDLAFWMFYENTTTIAEVREWQFQSTGGTPGLWTLANNGTLTYAVAPVPEAETWAMLLAGLGLVGMIARRRKVA